MHEHARDAVGDVDAVVDLRLAEGGDVDHLHVALAHLAQFDQVRPQGPEQEPPADDEVEALGGGGAAGGEQLPEHLVEVVLGEGGGEGVAGGGHGEGGAEGRAEGAEQVSVECVHLHK